MAEISTVRLVTENRRGLRCKPYLTFLISVGVRKRETIPFSAGNLLSVNGLKHLQGKRTMNLLYKLTIYEMDERRRRKNDDGYHIQSRRGLSDTQPYLG